MAVYPQLSSGALSQFPVVKQRCMRTISNAMADGGWVKLGDPGGATTEWQLEYCGLSDSEIGALQQFFQTVEGSLNGFTFLDPSANLLAWSEILNNAAWTVDPLLTLQSGVADVLGGTNGWSVKNAGSGDQRITQTLQAPGDYTYCYSVYARSVQSCSVILTVGNRSGSFSIGPNWSRVSLTGSGDANGNSVAFSIAVPAGLTIDLFGPQAEAQAAPSQYRTSTTGGVYPNARFRSDVFSFTTEDVNRHSATVSIFYANHL